jgi:hypothetical protein
MGQHDIDADAEALCDHDDEMTTANSRKRTTRHDDNDEYDEYDVDDDNDNNNDNNEDGFISLDDDEDADIVTMQRDENATPLRGHGCKRRRLADAVQR